MRKTIYLTRHGQTVLNAQGRTQGAFDSPLTELGIAQAKKAREYFDNAQIKFDTVICSTAERACDTCEIIWDGEYTRLKGLKEWHFGIFEGFPEEMKNGVNREEKSYGEGLVPFGGESRQAVGERMIKALVETLESTEGENVLAVTHGGAMWAFVLTANIDVIPQPPYRNCCVLKFEYENGKFYFKEHVETQ